MPLKDPIARREAMRRWQHENREKINAYHRSRYANNPEPQRKATLRWRKANRLHCNEKCRLWIKENRARLYNPNTEEGKARLRKENARKRELRSLLKIELLTHYGGGKLKCCWPKCSVTDIDLLTLDHVENNGAQHRREIKYKFKIYPTLKRQGFPKGYQTLCWNHQMKKEILRKRSAENGS